MRFLDIEELFEAFELVTSYSVEGINLLLKKVDNSQERKVLNYSKKDVIAFLQYHQNEKHLVFYQWILDCETLYKLLNSNILSNFSVSNNHFSTHKWLDEFKVYLTPFLSPTLTNFTNDKNNKHRKFILQFSQLLENEKQFEIQYEVNQQLKNNLDASTPIIETFDVHFIYAVNLLNRDFYSTKIKVLERFKNWITDEKHTVKEKKHLIALLQRLTLNSAHKDELQKLIVEARNNGYYKDFDKSSKNLWENKRLLLLALFILISGISYFLYKNTNNLNYEKPEIPPYGTDSLSQSEIDRINRIFSEEIDTIGVSDIPLGVEYEDSSDVE